MTSQHRRQMENWRGWTFQAHRLRNYLDAQTSAKPQPKEENSPKTEDLS
jgi:hypothetical protein